MSGADTPEIGGMSTSGRTNTVYIREPSPQDKAVLCPIICSCRNTPGVGVDGRKLNQVCASKKVKNLDWDYVYPYKAEVNYDMTQSPPEPIMDSTIATKVHDWLPGWIKKNWPDPKKGRPAWKPGIGLIRRPDIVKVKNQGLPPTQDNLTDLIEVKFPGDNFGAEQLADYEEILGRPPSILTPDNCECGDKQKERGYEDIKDVVTKVAPYAALAAWAAWIASGGRGPRPPQPVFP